MSRLTLSFVLPAVVILSVGSERLSDEDSFSKKADVGPIRKASGMLEETERLGDDGDDDGATEKASDSASDEKNKNQIHDSHKQMHYSPDEEATPAASMLTTAKSKTHSSGAKTSIKAGGALKLTAAERRFFDYNIGRSVHYSLRRQIARSKAAETATKTKSPATALKGGASEVTSKAANARSTEHVTGGAKKKFAGAMTETTVQRTAEQQAKTARSVEGIERMMYYKALKKEIEEKKAAHDPTDEEVSADESDDEDSAAGLHQEKGAVKRVGHEDTNDEEAEHDENGEDDEEASADESEDEDSAAGLHQEKRAVKRVEHEDTDDEKDEHDEHGEADEETSAYESEDEEAAAGLHQEKHAVERVEHEDTDDQEAEPDGNGEADEEPSADESEDEDSAAGLHQEKRAPKRAEHEGTVDEEAEHDEDGEVDEEASADESGDDEEDSEEETEEDMEEAKSEPKQHAGSSAHGLHQEESSQVVEEVQEETSHGAKGEKDAGKLNIVTETLLEKPQQAYAAGSKMAADFVNMAKDHADRASVDAVSARKLALRLREEAADARKYATDTKNSASLAEQAVTYSRGAYELARHAESSLMSKVSLELPTPPVVPIAVPAE